MSGESLNQKVELEELKRAGVTLFIKREDLLHPVISGNKYRKLKYNLERARIKKKRTLLTFGGAYSNHISAVSYAGKKFGFKTIGIIRGEELKKNLINTLDNNPTLRFANENGMKIMFISRSEYRLKESRQFLDKLSHDFGDFYLIPEGGTNELAVKGCMEILEEKDKEFDKICSAVGTGGTISGLINSSNEQQDIIGFPALKGDFLEKEIKKIVKSKSNWKLMLDYHFGGYGKVNEELVNFINNFKFETCIPLDPVYTGKMMFGILDMVKRGRFESGTKILAIHTGGLQGIEGMNINLKRKKMSIIV